MRVLEIMGSLHRGGAETMIMNYYRAFDKDICQMDFVVHMEKEDDFRQEAESMGARIFLLPRPGDVGALKYISALKKLIKEKGPFDAVHIHTNYQAFMGVIAAKLAGVKNVVVHSHTTSFKKHRLVVNRLFFFLGNVVRVACGKKAGDAFFGKDSYIVVSNAMDVSKFMYVDDNHVKNEKVVIGHIGRFVTPKNHAFIIELAKKLKQMNVDVVFKLFGDGELKEEMVRTVERNSLQDVVEFMGITNDTVAAYKSFDLFVLPSLFEGVPLTLIEAQLSGLVCLASDKVAEESNLDQGNLCFLPLDVELWAERIQTLIKDSRLSKSSITVNEKINEYDVRIQCKKLLSVYEGILK